MEFRFNPQTWLVHSQIYKNLRIITKNLWAIKISWSMKWNVDEIDEESTIYRKKKSTIYREKNG